MYIHIGEKRIVSTSECIGIFNADTLRMSVENSWITSTIDEMAKTVALLDKGFVSSGVSPFTVIKRTAIIFGKELIWRRMND